jgi:hypothetical protein
MTGDFTVDGYRALLVALFERGYRAHSFTDVRPERRHLILRHDLDMSLEAALPLAEVERSLEMRAAYFVLVRSEFYNPFTSAARATLDAIRGLGHEVGLHFDANLYPADRSALDKAAAQECALLQAGLGIEVRTISLHRPGKVFLGMEGRLAGRLHTYAPRFFQSMGYCSDSRGAWQRGHPLSHTAVAEGRGLQLLTHPIWWTGRPEETVKARLDRFARQRFDLLREELARNCEPYRDSMRVPSLEDESR